MLLECIASERRQGADLLVFTRIECKQDEKGEGDPASSLAVDPDKRSDAFFHSLAPCSPCLKSGSFATAVLSPAGLPDQQRIAGWEIDPEDRKKKEQDDTEDDLWQREREKRTKGRTLNSRCHCKHERRERGAFLRKTLCIPP